MPVPFYYSYWMISRGIWTATRYGLLSSLNNCAFNGAIMPFTVVSTFVGMPTSCHQYGFIKSSCRGRIMPMRKGYPLSSGIIHSVLRQLLNFPKIGSFAFTISCSTSSFLNSRGILRMNPLGHRRDLLITSVKSPTAV